MEVHTGTVESFSLQVRDQYQNKFDYAFHKLVYSTNSVFKFSLLGTMPDDSDD